ncbi:MAG TPA: glycosyltransferase family 39 protein [Anaerolineae bacterium]|nr:glycosyltransferase family 39 protein [Anaerolineae bacterium]
MGILLLAAYLRLNHLEWTEFKLDEAHLSQIAYDMARHGEIPLTGIGSSVGIMNPPLAAWLLAIPYALSSSPIVATAFIALLNVLAVALCYRLSRTMFASFGDRAWWAALIAALLFAVAPWAVLHSRKVWAQDLLPVFVMLYVWLGYRAFVQRRAWSLLGHGIALAALIQIHYSALWLAPVSLVWLIAFARRVRLAPVMVTVVIGAAAFAPFLIADGARGWPSVTRLLDLARQPATTDAAAIHFAWITTNGLEVHSLAGPQEFENFRALVPWSDGGSWLVGLLAIAGLIVAVIDVLRAGLRRAWDARSAVGFLLATWILLPVIAQLSHRTPLFVHYFLIILPAPFMLIGYLMVRVTHTHMLTRRLSLQGKGTFLAMTLVGIITLAQMYQVITLQQFVASRPTPGGQGIPIGYYEQMVNEARVALKQTGGAEIIVNTRGSNPNSDEYPAIFDFLLNDVPHRFVDMNSAMRVSPAVSHIQIDYAPNKAGAPDEPRTLPEAGRELITVITLRAGEQAGRVYRSRGYTSPPCAVMAAPARWSNGVSLLAAQIDPLKPAEKTIIRLCLKIDQASGEEYHWTAQLWDKHGQRRAQVDDNGYPTRYWRAGDVITQDLLLAIPADLPAGDYTLRVGQYTWPEVKPVLTLDVAGNPQSDAVEISVPAEQ